jgi:hypothetical protein
MSGSELSQDDILGLLYEPVLPYPSSAFFYIAGISERKTQLKDSDLEHVVNTLVGVAVRAFDTESFLIWWREDLRPFPTVETT